MSDPTLGTRESHLEKDLRIVTRERDDFKHKFEAEHMRCLLMSEEPNYCMRGISEAIREEELRKLRAERDELLEARKFAAGKPEGILQGLFILARECGLPQYSSKHALTFLREHIEELKIKIAAQSKKMYPIMQGPSVPWEAMAPHQAMAQANHGQTLERLAERGGLAPCEAWMVIQGIKYTFQTKVHFEDYAKNWSAYAERINLHYAELEQLKAKTLPKPFDPGDPTWDGDKNCPADERDGE